MSINTLATTLQSLTASASRITHAGERAGDVKHSLAATDRATNVLGFAPGYTVEQGLAETIAWMRSRTVS